MLQFGMVQSRFSTKIVDVQGDIIEDEELFDSTNKYNI